MLFNTAAFRNAISVPGHIALGLQTVHPVLNTLPTPSRKAVASKASLQACFNYVNGALLVAGRFAPCHMVAC